MKITITYILSFLLLAVTLNSCKPKQEGPSDELKKAAITNYANIVYANYSDALTKAQMLQTKINALVASPSQTTLDEARQAWKDAREPYGQTEVYRFYGGPVDDASGPEGLMNSWPMDEAFVDYVQGNATAGIINDVVNHPTISKSVIEGLNESGGETNISCGYHAIEFLLWGQDLSASSAGTRPYTDYVTIGGTNLNQARRGDYLKACAELLVDHLQFLVNQWSPSVTGNYRQTFLSGNADQALTYIIQGMGFLSKGELAGERLEVAYDSQLQEDEHSCFSDNTHMDVRMNSLGIKNVYLGQYTKTDGTTITGTSIYDVVKAANATTADDLNTAISNSTTACNNIQAPFDQQILASNPSGRQAVKTAIDDLKVQGDKIALAARALGLTIVIE
jgi:putative iron-regulated protein